MVTTGVAPAVTDILPEPVAESTPVFEMRLLTMEIPGPAVKVGAGDGVAVATYGLPVVMALFAANVPPTVPTRIP